MEDENVEVHGALSRYMMCLKFDVGLRASAILSWDSSVTFGAWDQLCDKIWA